MERIRVISIIFPFLALLLLGNNHSNVSTEASYPLALLVCGIMSLILAAFDVIGLTEHPKIRMLEKLYHLIAAPAMIATSGLFIISVFENTKYNAGYGFARRLTSGVLGLLYGLVIHNENDYVLDFF